MRRLTATPRPDWREKIESVGLVFSASTKPDGTQVEYWHESAYYEFSMDEVERLELVAEDMHRMCLEAARFLGTGAMGDLGIGPQARELAVASLEAADPDVYGRFDFAYDGHGDAKLFEYNADTPTGLIEASLAQWYWLQDVMPEKDQWNGIHEALIEQWKRYRSRTGMSRLHLAHAGNEDSGEDWMTTAYMRDVAEQAGWATVGINMADIGWNHGYQRFVDLDDYPISTLFKLYPWEQMVREPFGQYLLARELNPAWVEPAWKMLLSNKALLAALWHLYPGHPNLLPAYLDSPRDLEAWVAKPLHGREGDNIRIHAPGIELEQPGDYGREGWCYQAYQQLPDFDGNHPVLGLWVVNGESVGCGIRESDGPVTDFYCRFVPNTIDAPAPAVGATAS
ncbi:MULTISPECIES: glutathionylspermidine synthase family protein [Arthrobacter]|uniref:Glutathionylspermidine synthase family protein n=2 Tax=Arthrobacter TaxID=1663 RepID=A0ABU9KMJ8_9MICC|nr:glutathionylspermidine synthase family protein [Arthrobacter sp. YJM1]MDP5227951.1 glutathionylspermidine synthase family protein [Arthrobacter sp. YJM1]